MSTRKWTARIENRLAKKALGYPEAVEDDPWGHRAFKVREKMFLVLGGTDEFLSVTVKLPVSNADAVTLPFAEPSGYGLGKSGWVTSVFRKGDVVPFELFDEWIDESYRAVAPRKLTALLEE